MYLNKVAASKLLDPINTQLRDAVSGIMLDYPTEFASAFGWSFRVICFSDGPVAYSEPEIEDAREATTIEVLISSKARLEYCRETHDPYKDFIARFTFYTADLVRLPARYTIYHIGFECDVEDNSFDQFRAGYIGITKRSPITRLKEHQLKVTRATGSVLHRAWRALVDGEIPHIPAFKVFSVSCASLDDAYSEEERLVAAHTLNPVGLNAIPGGMAGIRMMHELRLLSSTSQVSVEDRERAIERLCNRADRRSAKAHFRTGHVRRLQSGTKTWVRSCWVNLAAAA